MLNNRCKRFVFLALTLMLPAGSPAAKPQAPFRVLYSNDFTNNMVTISPFHREGQPWTPEMLEASVDEAAAAEVHMLQPTTTWVPWWPSKIYSIQEHRRWWKEYYGVDIIEDINGSEKYVHQYLLEGGDPLKVYVERCGKNKVRPFISFRLNDGHHKEYALKPKNKTGTHTTSKFYVEHPEYMIGKDKYQTYSRVELLQNWAIPEVRDHKFALIEEVCKNYDIAGIELDFMRHFGFFNLEQTTRQERVEIITAFVRQIRRMLNETASPGEYRWLCIRIPCYIAWFDTLGLDLPQLYEAGVDMFNLSASYFTVQQNDMVKIRPMVPEAAVYIEMCHTTRLGKRMHAKAYDSNAFRRTTPLQYCTTVHLAYSRGLNGVSLFNFVYYRPYGTNLEERGPWHEPPFEVLEHLDDPEWLAKQPQHYFWRVNKSTQINETGSSPCLQNTQFPERFSEGTRVIWEMDMAPPAGGWQRDGKFRIQSDESLESSRWSVRLNGLILKSTEDTGEPYESPYPHLLGEPDQHRAWIVPKKILKNGINKIEVRMDAGQKAKNIVFIDLAVR